MNVHNFIFQKTLYLLNLPRTYCMSPKGKKYVGFTYYPRSEKFNDPPYEPSKLFLIMRIKSMKGRTATEKQCLAQLNIDGDKRVQGNMSIVKNTPNTNALLWKVKHVIEIKPITWKGELPKDFSGTYLRKTGELVISPSLKVTEEQFEATEQIPKLNKKPSRVYLQKYLSKKWWDGFTGTA